MNTIRSCIHTRICTHQMISRLQYNAIKFQMVQRKKCDHLLSLGIMCVWGRRSFIYAPCALLQTLYFCWNENAHCPPSETLLTETDYCNISISRGSRFALRGSPIGTLGSSLHLKKRMHTRMLALSTHFSSSDN